MAHLIIQLALPTPLRRLFEYQAPTTLEPQMLHIGMRFLVPFGRRQLVGILLGWSDQPSIASEKLKTADALLDTHTALPERFIQLCQWTARYYHHSIGDTFSTALPTLLRQGHPAQAAHTEFWQATVGACLDDPRLTRARRQKEALTVLMMHPQGIESTLCPSLGIRAEALKELQKKQLIHRYRAPKIVQTAPAHWLLEVPPPLHPEQSLAVTRITEQLDQFRTFLLAGVTGSGKTEVYLQVIHQVLRQGRQALVLIPEINLGPQTLARFTNRFQAQIVLLHSGLTDRERLDAWLAARDGTADIIIGTRSAIFTPLQRPGVLIVDEEQDASYKQQEGLRYHARDLALVRAQQEHIPVILGSATPSLESLHNAALGRFALLSLQERAGGARLPTLERLDIKSRPLDGGCAPPLLTAIGQTLAAGQQVLVFLNRRGFAPTLLCHDCGWVSHCLHCDARMTLHQKIAKLCCHHCGAQETIPKHCPACGQPDLRSIGAGTERTEGRLTSLFPGYPVVRIDRDSTARKGTLQALLHIIEQGQPCLLLGTQMLAKGHHFPRVSLVAILDADSGLFSADFRAAEHLAQLIIQVAGRAGRAETPGKVLIQTHNAAHPLLVQLSQKGYFAFANEALEERRNAALPPFGYLALVRAQALHAALAETFLEQARDSALQILSAQNTTEPALLGPVPAPMERRAGRYHAQLLLQTPDRRSLHQLLSAWVPLLEQLPSSSRVRWSIDIDPIDLY